MRRTGKSSVLSRQKPRRLGYAKLSTKRSFRFSRKSVILIFGTLIVLVFVIHARNHKLHHTSHGKRTKIQWNVDLQLEGEHPLTDRKSEEVRRIAQDLLRTGDRSELVNLASSIQRVDGYGHVHALRVTNDRLLISLRPRIPVMCVEADQLRLVSDQGEIYGLAGIEGKPSCPGPKLIGIFGNNEKFELSDTQTVNLTPEVQTAVLEAITLLNDANSHEMKFLSIEFRKHRGFTVQLDGIETMVSLGRAPFLPKLDKLKLLLGKLASRGEVAMRIELDYQGKAFVKLKKL